MTTILRFQWNWKKLLHCTHVRSNKCQINDFCLNTARSWKDCIPRFKFLKCISIVSNWKSNTIIFAAFAQNFYSFASDQGFHVTVWLRQRYSLAKRATVSLRQFNCKVNAFLLSLHKLYIVFTHSFELNISILWLYKYYYTSCEFPYTVLP